MKLFGAGRPDHPMADRKQARKLLDELPPQDLKALEELAHWHESVAGADGFKPEERVQVLAMLEEAAQPRLKKVARDYLGAARVQQNVLWTRIHDYWRLAGQAYARAFEAQPLPELAAGALRAFAQQLKWQHLRYGPIDAAVWARMNAVYAAAEAKGMGPAAKPEFVKAALFGASAMDSRLAAEMELAERLIETLAAGFALEKSAAPELPYWIDLGRAMLPARAKQAPQPGAGVRFFGPGIALNALRSLIKTLEKGQVPAELKLGNADAETVLGVARHLAAHWAPAPPERKHKRVAVTSQFKIAHGFAGVVEALGGDTDSLDFGAGEPLTWTAENVSAGGFGALAPLGKSDWIKVGALVAAWPDGAPGWMVGTVRRVSKVSAQEIRIGVETLSRSPAITHFALPGNGALQGVLLPAPSGESSIALKAGAYTRGENLETMISGKQLVYMPQGVAERGEDYEIVKAREMIRE